MHNRFSLRPGALRRLMKPLMSATLGLAISFAAVGAAEAKRVERKITVGKMERTYIAHVPSGAGSNGPMSVIFAFHPLLSTAGQFEYIAKLHELPSASNYIVVYPQGFWRSWNAGHCCGKAQRDGIDDLGFINAMFADLENLAPISRSRNFATGYSNGAGMSYMAACKMNSRFSAVVGVAGVADMRGISCESAQPVSILHLHGTNDKFNVWDESKSAKSGPDVRQLVNFWRERDSCGPKENVTRLGKISCEAYSCSSGVEVDACSIEGMGHVWPGFDYRDRTDKNLGGERADLPGSREAMAFFNRH